MASITKQPNGRKTIQFTGADGKRRSLRMGKTSMRSAEAVKVKVEQLASAKVSGHSVDDDTNRWVSNLDTVMVDKLAAVGLVPKRESTALGPFIAAYIESRVDVKETTTELYHYARRNLVEFFGENKTLREITPGDADEWRLHLISKGLAENTARKRCCFAKQLFTAAVRKGLVPQNPFADLKSAIQANDSRFYFVSREEAQKVIDACPDTQWRLLFALCRFGGLRCPSEHLSLRWNDINWEHNRMNVRSPKTEHHPGGESRMVPIFPELRPFLDEAFELAEPGEEFVITHYRKKKSNLRSKMIHILRRAGVKPWPKLFQNLRSTRQTELEEVFPSHVVCSWIGNSESVAKKHYLQITDEHFQKAVQNPVQQLHVGDGNSRQPEKSTNEKTPVLQGVADYCEPSRSSQNVVARQLF